MNEKKKQTANKQKPVEVVEVGEVKAEVYVRQSNCGLVYYQYVLSRIWRAMATGKVAQSSALFESNENDAVQVIREVSARIREIAAKGTGTSVSDKSRSTREGTS